MKFISHPSVPSFWKRPTIVKAGYRNICLLLNEVICLWQMERVLVMMEMWPWIITLWWMKNTLFMLVPVWKWPRMIITHMDLLWPVFRMTVIPIRLLLSNIKKKQNLPVRKVSRVLSVSLPMVTIAMTIVILRMFLYVSTVLLSSEPIRNMLLSGLPEQDGMFIMKNFLSIRRSVCWNYVILMVSPVIRSSQPIRQKRCFSLIPIVCTIPESLLLWWGTVIPIWNGRTNINRIMDSISGMQKTVFVCNSTIIRKRPKGCWLLCLSHLL